MIDLEAMERRVPRGATCKGVLMHGVVKRARAVEPTFDPRPVVEKKVSRYLPFLDYPYVDLLRLIPVAAELVHPEESLEDAIRKLAHPVYGDVRETRAGRLIVDIFSGGMEGVLLTSPRPYGLFVSVGHFQAEKAGARHVRVHFRDYPGYLDTYDVGVFEGVLQAFDREGTVEATRASPTEGIIDVRWG